MKKLLISLLCLLLALSMVLVSCKKDDPPPSEDNGDTPPAETEQTEDGYIVKSNYLPESVHNKVATAMTTEKDSFGAFSPSQGPFTPIDVSTITDCRIKAIHIPVYSTKEPDAQGNYIFTMYITGALQEELRGNPVNMIQVAVNGAEHNLTPNTSKILRYIRVDLSERNIVLGKGQTLSFVKTTDTLIPAYVDTRATAADDNAISRWMKMQWGWCGFFAKTFTDTLQFDRDIMCFDLEMEVVYDSEDDYKAEVAAKQAEEADFQAKIDALKAAGYQGKKLSLIGDSISTCDGVTNNHLEYNSNLERNRCYYWKSTNVCDWTLTYWGRLAVALDMELCVINAWSASKVYGGGSDEDGQSDARLDNMLERADQLHNDYTGEKPDLIIVYMATNDMRAKDKWDMDLLDELSTTQNKVETMANWFAEVKAIAAGYTPGDTVQPGTTYESWQASYALGIELMTQMYPDAEIRLMTLMESNNHPSSTPENVDDGNLCIRAICEYFAYLGINIDLIDQENNGYINKQNAYLYGHDENDTLTALHPNIQGMELMFRCIIEELYADLPK